MSYKSNTSIFLFCHFAIDEDSEDQKAQGMNDLCYSDIVLANNRYTEFPVALNIFLGSFKYRTTCN